MQSENEPADASISIALTALDFQPDIERLTRDFAGREWIFADIEHWVRHSDERIFILTGEPGIGKSAVAARLTQLRSDIAAHHFCIAGRNSTITPGTVLRSLAAQLGIKLPNYGFALANTVKPERLAVNVHIYAETMTGGQISGVVIRNLASTDAMEEFEILLRGALQALEVPPEPLLILIDSLDQAATYTGEPNLIQLLAKAQDLPSWVRFIFTTRPDRRVLRYFEPLQPHSLSDESQLNRDDIRRYILNRAQQPALDTRLTAIHADREGFADALTAFSSGNFLYARMLLDGIAQGTQSLDDLSTLPRGLGEIYHSFLTRFTPQEWEARYQPLLLVLVVALEPLNEARLQKFTGIAHTQVRQGLGVLRQFLDVGEDVQHNETFSLFHRSFRDYLTDEKANRDFWCAPADGHRAISDSYQYASGAGYEQIDDYGLRYLPTHLAGATQRAALKTLLLDFVWLRAKLAAIGVAAAIADCDLLLDDPGVRIVRDALRLAAHVLARDPTQVGTQLLGRIDPRDAKADEPMLSALLAKAAVSMDHLWLRPLRASLAHALEPLVGTFAMHDDSVKALAITSDGKRAISADSSGVVKVWEIERGTEVFSLRVDEREILALAVAPDGRRAFSAGWDYALTCWNLETGRSCGRRMAANQVITSVQVSANGTGVFCGSIDEHINAFAVESGEHLGWLADNQRITALAISPDGHWLLSGGDVGCTLWRIASRERIRQFNTDSSDPKPTSYAYPGLLLPMAVTADSQQVVVGSPVLSVWDIATGERLRVISPESVRALALAPDGHLAVTADKQLVTLWDLTKGRRITTLFGHIKEVNAVGITPDAKFVLSASDDHTVKIWDLSRATRTLSWIGHEPTVESAALFQPDNRVNSIAVAPDGRLCATGSFNGEVKVWDVATGRELLCFTVREPNRPYSTDHLSITPDSRYLLAMNQYEWGYAWELATGQKVDPKAMAEIQGESKSGTEAHHEPPLHEFPVRLTLTRNGEYELLILGEGFVKVKDLASGRETTAFTGEGPFASVAVAPDQQTIVVGEVSGRVHFLRIEGKLMV